MSDFFHGWRRKTGCITLVVATILANGWIQSLSREVTVVFFDGSGHQTLSSLNGNVYWEPGNFEWTFDPGWVTWWSRDLRNDGSAADWEEYWRIPYWTFVVPLTLLSAYLILWPGKRRADHKPILSN